MIENTGGESGTRRIRLEAGWTYRIHMADGRVCSFDLTSPRQTWILLPRTARGLPTDASRQDWMLVIDETVELQRGRPVTVQIFEDSGSSWTWVGSTPNRVLRASETDLPVSISWR